MTENENSLINESDGKKNNSFDVLFKSKNGNLKIGKNVSLIKASFVLGEECEIIIGDNCIIKGKILAQHKGSKIIIGDNVKFNGICRLHAAEGKKIEIGDGCLLADVRFRTSDSHSIIDLSQNGKRTNLAENICVGKNVWIAENVYIYKGVNIGEGTVVGARSTVIHSLPEYSVCAGNPAKVLRRNVSWKEKLL